MPSVKRPLDEPSSARKSKKTKTEAPISQDVDFPRGGGTTFTPLEVKAIRAEAVREADADLIKDTKKRKRNSEKQSKASSADKIRIEHLNYKRLNTGMKLLAQIVAVEPLALVVSLPNQLFAHVPITNVSSQLTALLEKTMGEEGEHDEDDDSSSASSPLPELADIFRPGQYVRAVVDAVHAAGSTDNTGLGRARDAAAKASRRVELSLLPERVNAGVSKNDLKPGFTLSAAIQSLEDHGYILNLGLTDISGFLSYKDAPKKAFVVGQLVNATVTSKSKNGRTCNVAVDEAAFSDSCLSEATNASSVLPGTLVQALVTEVSPNGLNVQTYKLGKKLKARVLYDYSTTPPRFALGLTQQMLSLRPQKPELTDAYPIGTILEDVKVLRVEAERGVVVEVDSGAAQGFAHISHVSDDHVPSLSSSGPWKPGSLHAARVTGYFAFDRLLQLSFKPSVLEQKFLQVMDVQVGEVIKGTIKKLSDSNLIVSLFNNVDGVIWPNHYADIALKHPSKRFKAGASIKCRVLVVDQERKRLALTAKKTLIDSTLPIIATLDDVRVGTVVHAVVSKIFDKHILVEFFNHLKAIVPSRELSETTVTKLSESFPVGKVLKVRVISLDTEHGRIVASVKQASSHYDVIADISAVEIGNIVSGTLTEVQADNAVLILQPSQVRALISLNNLANDRKISVAQTRNILRVGATIQDLVVVTRNVEKSFVIVACKPKPKDGAGKGSLAIESLTVGDLLGGRVTRHTRHGSLVKVTNQIGGTLHPTDIADDYSNVVPFPSIDTTLRASIVSIDVARKLVVLSTRNSRMRPDEAGVVADREILGLSDLVIGETVRGFVKNIAEHGLFVSVGRDIDARVQIRELFDDFVKDWKERFTLHQLVKGRILSVDIENKRVEMTLRTGDLNKSKGSTRSVSDLQVGQKIDGVVSRIEDYGLFIQIKDSKIIGLCHKSQLSDNASADVAVAVRSFRQGDRVKAVIIEINKQKVAFSLKPSHFNDEDFETGDGETEPGEEQEEADDDDDQDASEPDEDGEEDEEAESIHLDLTTTSFQPNPPAPKPAPKASTALALTGGFRWSNPQPGESDGDVASDDSDSDASDHEEDSGRKPKKRRKKAIELDLTAEMHTKTPESNADFERLLLGSPNSSYLWVQYMSFQLQLSEVDKARAIARRGLQTINFREEQEKLNIWIALLNLENARFISGSPRFLDQSEKQSKSEEQYLKTCKKFGQSSKVWTLFGEFYLRQGKLEDARKLLPRCLQSLDKRKHLKTISKFAQLEYKLADPERGKTLFEGIVDSHPKRLDLWSVYMDMEAGQGQIQTSRNLFDRVLAQKLTSHKAKAFFKKWLELEKRIGDEEGVENVKAKAVEWTEKAA
ncbi:hypothetical protein MKEN_00811100 [Mycena kentingensis (nom. inval.)]|nr:hypothetical protein MKEN_00811100 [Mycena kentingensis (nom. inval.)]